MDRGGVSGRQSTPPGTSLPRRHAGHLGTRNPHSRPRCTFTRSLRQLEYYRPRRAHECQSARLPSGPTRPPVNQLAALTQQHEALVATVRCSGPQHRRLGATACAGPGATVGTQRQGLYPSTMTVVEWILIILLMIPAALVCWALFKSGELQTVAARLRVLRPAARRRIWITFLLVTITGTALGAAIVWAFSTSHTVLGLAILVGIVMLKGIVTPFLRTRRIKRKSASVSREAKKL